MALTAEQEQRLAGVMRRALKISDEFAEKPEEKRAQHFKRWLFWFAAMERVIVENGLADEVGDLERLCAEAALQNKENEEDND